MRSKFEASLRLMPRTILTLAVLAGAFLLACDLDEGRRFEELDDPGIVINPSAVTTSVEVFPFNLVADGETHGSIAARILVDGRPVPGIPVLFYSEWGQLFTACTGAQVPPISAFSNGIITNPDGFASTLMNAPVLPHQFRDDNESNTIAAFFLVNGQVFSAYTTQVLYQVQLAGLSDCRVNADGTASFSLLYAGRGNTLPVSGCASFSAQAISPGASASATSGCSTGGRARVTVSGVAPTGPTTVQVTAEFVGAGLNECILDEDRNLSVTNFITIRPGASQRCQIE
jgi:hypothetical protein